jgi:hypothetical protein
MDKVEFKKHPLSKTPRVSKTLGVWPVEDRRNDYSMGETQISPEYPPMGDIQMRLNLVS